MKDTNNFLREYISLALTEGMYWHDTTSNEKGKKSDSFVTKIVNFLKGTSASDALVDNWIEDKELYFDVEVSDELQSTIKSFAVQKYKKALIKTHDKDKAEKMVRKALDMKFYPKFRELEKKMSMLEDE